MQAIQHFKQTEGNLTKSAPTDFLDTEQKEALIDEQEKFRISLYKMLLFEAIFVGIKSGQLNL